ncbi:MAG: SAM domain-containing protein, partial [Xanthomonadales bacterium]|nr:SAM domain-containing protein [Xanthomonadales bacterium]
MGSKSEMAAWLEPLGLGQYAETFAQHEIDLSILPDLSDDDFAEIGVPLGPRRKIQKALSKPARAIPGVLPQDSAERR